MRYTRLKVLALALGMAGLATFSARAAGETFIGADVGSPAFLGSAVTSGTQITIKGGGADIWGNADQFFYYYTPKDGAFDVVVQVRSLEGPDGWTKAELMIREAADDGTGKLVPSAGDRHISNMTTRTAGVNMIEGQARLTTGGASTEYAATPAAKPSYPNTWLRLTRAGSLFAYYYGTDGVNWNLISYNDTSVSAGGSFSNSVVVGLAVTAHNDGDVNGATAVFDNFAFLTPPPEVVNPAPANHASYVSPSTNFSFTVKSTQGVPSTNIVFKVNGVDKSSALTFTGTDFTRKATYTGPFVQNQVYNFSIIPTDIGGLKTTNNFSFDTFLQTNFSIEAEDFNFSAGQYVDNPPIGTASPYIVAIGTPLIDEYRPDTGGNHDYRNDVANSVADVVGVRVMPGTEVNRQVYVDAYAGGAGDPLAFDYIVGWIANTEWLNYTRTFPAGTYQMYARIANGDGAGSVNRIDWVTSSPAIANQTTSPAGIIQGPTTGSYDVFSFTPLTDAVGNKLVQRFTAGVKTMRYTKLSGGCDLNFFSFVPVADPGVLTPFLSAIYPTQNLTAVSPTADITATITDRDTKLTSASVQMVLDGTNDVTASLTKVPVTGGLKVTYSSTNVYPASSVHTVTLIYADNAATPNKLTNTWQFTVVGGYATLPAADAKSVGSGQTPGFTTRLVQTSNGSANTTQWTEDTLVGVYPVIYSATDSSSLVINYNGNGSSGNFPNDTMFSAAFGVGIVDASAANIATETVAYLELKRGFYRMGVNSDDGFRVTEGTLPGNAAPKIGTFLGEYSGGRGATDTTFDFVAPVDGVYPFRLTYEQGAGGFGFEWFSVDPATGIRTLINDTAVAGSIKAYRFCREMPQNVVSIAAPLPPTLSVPENGKFTLTAAGRATLYGDVITNVLLFSYHWTLDGGPIMDPDARGTESSSLSFSLAKSYDTGKYECEVSMPGFPAVKVSTQVTVVPDTVAPGVASLNGNAGLNSITVNFSEPVDGSTLVAGNFKVDGGLTVSAANYTADPISGYVVQVTLSTSPQTEGKLYTVTINNVADMIPNKMVNVKAPFNAYITDPTVKMLCEFYDNIGSIGALEASAKYIAGTPDRVITSADFQTPTWENGANYGGRLASVVTAPVTGNYIFHITSDDNGQLFVSTDETPGNWVLAADGVTTYVAAVNGWSGQREWSNTNSVPSAPIALVKGNKYYIMALWNEGGGGDGCAVGWAIPGDTNIVVIPASAMGSQKVDISNAKIMIGQQPVAVTVAENSKATFSLTVTNAASQFSTNETVSYQWQRNGVNVASNGNSASYTIATTKITDGGTFQAVLHVPGLSVTSAPALLTVTPDTTAPAAVSAGTLTTAPTTVGVAFSEFVAPASAQTIANYTVSGATVTNVTLLPSGKAVALALNAAVVSGATVKVENVKDMAATANTMASTTLTVSFNQLTAKDVGTPNATNSAVFSDPVYVGSTVAIGQGVFTVKAGGTDIWETQDGFHFTYREMTGDFEAKVRVQDLLFTSTWAKAGLMVRESLEGGSRNLNTVVDPAAGANVWEPNYRAETKGSSGGIPGEIPRVTPVSYPNAWIKMTRAGQVVATFKSTNGVDWVQLVSYTNTSATNPYPAKMLVGICTTAHENNGTNTVAEYSDFVLTAGGAPAESPTITVSRVKPNLVLTWDATKGAGFSLFSAATVKGPWSLESTAPVTASGVVTVTLPSADASKFFRLQK